MNNLHRQTQDAGSIIDNMAEEQAKDVIEWMFHKQGFKLIRNEGFYPDSIVQACRENANHKYLFYYGVFAYDAKHQFMGYVMWPQSLDNGRVYRDFLKVLVSGHNICVDDKCIVKSYMTIEELLVKHDLEKEMNESL